MRVTDYIIGLIKEIIYLVVTVIYLIRLDNLNRELLSQNFAGAWELLAYKQYAALKFFCWAAILFFIGCVLLHSRICHMRRYEEAFGQILSSILAIAVISILLVLIFLFIDNPILRAVFTVGVVIAVLSSSGN